MQKKTFLAAVAAFTLAVVVIPSTFAFGGFRGGGKFDPEIHAAIQEAFENEDYGAYQEAIANLPDGIKIKKFTEEKFNEIVEKRTEMEVYREAIQDAIESGDYEEWKNLMEEKKSNSPLLEAITEDNFSKLQELHELRGKTKLLLEELGIETKPRFGSRRGGFSRF